MNKNKKLSVFICLLVITLALADFLISCDQPRVETDFKKIKEFKEKYEKQREPSIFNYTDREIIVKTPDIVADIYLKLMKYCKDAYYDFDELKEFATYVDFITFFLPRSLSVQLFFYGYGMDPETNEKFTTKSNGGNQYISKQKNFLISLYSDNVFDTLQYEIIPVNNERYPKTSRVILDFSGAEKQPDYEIYFSFIIGEDAADDWMLLSGLEWQFEPYY